MEKLQAWPAVIAKSPEKVTDVWRSWHVSNPSNATPESEFARSSGHYEHKRALSTEAQAPSTLSHTRSARIWRRMVNTLSLLWYLIPRRGRPMRQQKPLHQMHPMAYLDALRGYLALIIYTGHAIAPSWRFVPQRILDIPWLQVPFRGGYASLGIFFWISGYVITYRMVGFMQKKQYDKFLEALTSSMFRRYLRLFLPVLAVTFVTVMLVQTSIVMPPDFKVKEMNAAGNPLQFWFNDSIQAINPFTHVTGWWMKRNRPGSQFLDHFWSINTEFRSSIMLYSFCAAVCKMSSNRRKVLIWLIVPWLIYWQANYAAMAFVGMWFAECRQGKLREAEGKNTLVTMTSVQPVHPVQPISPTHATNKAITIPVTPNGNISNTNLLSIPDIPSISDSLTTTTTNNQPPPSPSTLQKIQSIHTIPLRIIQPHAKRTLTNITTKITTLRQPLLLLSFILSFILLHNPHTATTTSPALAHRALRSITPTHWAPEMKIQFQLSIASIMLLLPLDQIPVLQRPLLSPLSQYLGELSFGIYAMQYTVLWTVWEPRYLAWLIGRYGIKQFDGFWHLFPGWCVMTIILLWAAELFARFDIWVVKFCRDLEIKLFA